MKKTLFIGGTFNDKGGKKSRIAEKVFEGINEDAVYLNGGNFSELEGIATGISLYDVAYWFPNIPNEKDKLVSRLKAGNRHLTLITSKRNVEKIYSEKELISHALKNRSNLFIDIRKKEGVYISRMMDVLGNQFIETSDFGLLGKAIKKKS